MINAITEFLNNWENEANKYFLETALKGYQIEMNHHELSKSMEYSDSMTHYKETVKKYWEINKTAYDMIRSSCWCGNIEVLKEYISKQVKKDRVNKEKALIKRVIKITGEITDAKYLKVGVNGELNGFIIGTEGKANIETIFAGGYNIQCLHFRVLVKKVK